MTLSRRSFIARSLALGCSAAASPLMTPVTFASAPWDNRLIVILLRGGMDGLGVVQPYGDPNWANLRRANKSGANKSGANKKAKAPTDLDGYFSLHPALARLRPMWRAGELGFAQAVSTPYRDKRSHFDGQDLLEAGTTTLDGTRDGWLNRLLQVSGASDPHTAFALGRENLFLLSGEAPHYSWMPEADLALSPQALLLAELSMSGDPAFGAALNDALRLAGANNSDEIADMDEDAAEPSMTMDTGSKLIGHRALARYAGQQLTGPARIAAFSLNGWDTHRRQDLGLGKALKRLANVLLALQDALGPVWNKTAILAVTEFGRTVALNGTRGTDHGTGGAMLFAGGALRGGQVVTDWPGLAEADLYERRDLMPTRDVRAHAAWVMRSLFGISISDLERSVFPGLDMGDTSRIVL